MTLIEVPNSSLSWKTQLVGFIRFLLLSLIRSFFLSFHRKYFQRIELRVLYSHKNVGLLYYFYRDTTEILFRVKFQTIF